MSTEFPDYQYIEVLASQPQKSINELRRFTMLVIGAFCCICCSFDYIYNLVSEQLRERYNLTQRDLTTISTAALVVQYVSLPYSLLYDYFGTFVLLTFSSVYLILGTTLLSLCFTNHITGNVVRLSVFYAMLMLGGSLFDTVACVGVLSHFPTRRGAVIAQLKTFIGLGSAIVGSLYTAFFTEHLENYMYFLLAFTLTVAVFCFAFMRLPEYHLTGYEMSHLSEEEKERRLQTKTQYLRQEPPSLCFLYGFVIVAILIIYLPTEGALIAYLDLGQRYKAAFGITAAVLTLLFIGVAFPCSLLFSKRSQYNNEVALTCANLHEPMNNRTNQIKTEMVATVESKNDVSNEFKLNVRESFVEGEDQTSNSNDTPLSSPHEKVETDVDYIAPQYHDSFWRNLRLPELWCLWWLQLCLGGSEFVIIYNATDILSALQGYRADNNMRALLTILNGVGSAVGRIVMAGFEYWSQTRPAEKRIPLTIALYFPTSSVLLTLILFLSLPPAALPLPYVLAAFGNGFMASTTILVTRTLFAKDPAKHYSFCYSCLVISAIAFNRFLFGEWYMVQAGKQNHTDKQCYGKVCMILPFCVLLGLAASTLITSTFVHLRYTRLCKLALKERQRIIDQKEQMRLEQRAITDIVNASREEKYREL